MQGEKLHTGNPVGRSLQKFWYQVPAPGWAVWYWNTFSIGLYCLFLSPHPAGLMFVPCVEVWGLSLDFISEAGKVMKADNLLELFSHWPLPIPQCLLLALPVHLATVVQQKPWPNVCMETV